MPDDLALARQAGLTPRIACHVRAWGKGLELTFNGRRLESSTPADGWLDFAVAPDALRKGLNRLGFANPVKEQALVISDVALSIRYAPAE